MREIGPSGNGMSALRSHRLALIAGLTPTMALALASAPVHAQGEAVPGSAANVVPAGDDPLGVSYGGMGQPVVAVDPEHAIGDEPVLGWRSPGG